MPLVFQNGGVEMMERYFFVGAPFEIGRGLDLAGAFAASGHNFGNLFIGNGLYREISGQKYFRKGTEDAGWIEENFDKIVIPAANFIHEKFDFGWLYDFLRRIELPVFVSGLGAQAPSTRDRRINVPVGTRNFLSLVAERAVTIGVRGYFTAEVVSGMGISNLRVTGCPSMFTSCQPTIRIQRIPSWPDLKVVINGSRNVVGHSYDREAAIRAESSLLAYAMAHDAPYVLQNEMPELALAAGEAGEGVDGIEAVAKLLGVRAGGPALAAYLRACGRYFRDVGEWVEWIKGYDYVIGTRFHGCMAALLAGRPTLVVVHDSRTREMCEFFNIPHCGVEDFSGVDPRFLYERSDFDLFELSYNNIFRKFVEFLDENSMSHPLVWAPYYPRGGHLRSLSGALPAPPAHDDCGAEA